MDTPDVTHFERPLFFTGAGISVESGIPTYRGRGGIWTQYDYEEIACQTAFERDPNKVWDYHDWRREKMAEAEPNAGHRIIAALQAEKPDTTVVTQNIDGLHQRAGATNVVELHGTVWRVRCDAEGKIHEDFNIPLPSRKCTCGEYLRPDIVWFHDSLKPEVLQAAVEALAECDVLVSVGTSAVVYPAAELPAVAKRLGRLCIEINPEETPMSGMYDHVMRTSASEGLAKLWPHLA